MFTPIVYQRVLAMVALGVSWVGVSFSQAQDPGAYKPPAAAVKVAFGEFFQMPFGPKGLTFTPKAKALAGQWVSIKGYMVKMEQPLTGQFILSPRPVEINDHADGDANDLPANAVLVLLDTTQSEAWVTHRSGLIELQGQLELGRQETSQAQVSWIRIKLDPKGIVLQAHPTPLAPLNPMGHTTPIDLKH